MTETKTLTLVSLQYIHHAFEGDQRAPSTTFLNPHLTALISHHLHHQQWCGLHELHDYVCEQHTSYTQQLTSAFQHHARIRTITHPAMCAWYLVCIIHTVLAVIAGRQMISFHTSTIHIYTVGFDNIIHIHKAPHYHPSITSKKNRFVIKHTKGRGWEEEKKTVSQGCCLPTQWETTRTRKGRQAQ